MVANVDTAYASHGLLELPQILKVRVVSVCLFGSSRTVHATYETLFSQRIVSHMAPNRKFVNCDYDPSTAQECHILESSGFQGDLKVELVMLVFDEDPWTLGDSSCRSNVRIVERRTLRHGPSVDNTVSWSEVLPSIPIDRWGRYDIRVSVGGYGRPTSTVSHGG